MTTGYLRPLKVANFRWFFLGEVVNSAGSSMSGVALAFAVLHIDNSPTALGWVVAAFTIPMVVFMLLGGAIADVLPRALVLRGCNLILGVAQALAAVLVLTGVARIWQLVVLQFIAGTVFAVGYPAFHGMVPILLPEADRKQAFLLLSQSDSGLRILGPAIAGLIAAIGNPGWALAVDAATFFVASIFLSLLRIPGRAHNVDREPMLREMVSGWQFARQLGWVIPVACFSLIYNAAISGGLNVLGPVISVGTVGSQGWGFARSAQALGLFLFAFALARMTIRRPLIACQCGFVTSALPLLVLGLFAHEIPLVLAFFVAGCGSALISLSWSMTVQEKIPEHMLSRIMAIDGFFSFVAMPIGELLAGPTASRFGAQHVAVAAAVLCVVTCAVALTRPVLRRVTQRAVPSVPEAG